MRYKRINPFIKAHGAEPGPLMRPILTGATASEISAVITVLILLLICFELNIKFRFSLVALFFGMILYSLFAGILYGKIYRRAANDRRGGWIFGASTGFILWMVNPIIWLPWFGYKELFSGSTGLLIVFTHVIHGTMMGLFFPRIHLICARKWKTLGESYD